MICPSPPNRRRGPRSHRSRGRPRRAVAPDSSPLPRGPGLDLGRPCRWGTLPALSLGQSRRAGPVRFGERHHMAEVGVAHHADGPARGQRVHDAAGGAAREREHGPTTLLPAPAIVPRRRGGWRPGLVPLLRSAQDTSSCAQGLGRAPTCSLRAPLQPFHPSNRRLDRPLTAHRFWLEADDADDADSPSVYSLCAVLCASFSLYSSSVQQKREIEKRSHLRPHRPHRPHFGPVNSE